MIPAKIEINPAVIQNLRVAPRLESMKNKVKAVANPLVNAITTTLRVYNFNPKESKITGNTKVASNIAVNKNKEPLNVKRGRPLRFSACIFIIISFLSLIKQNEGLVYDKTLL